MKCGLALLNIQGGAPPQYPPECVSNPQLATKLFGSELQVVALAGPTKFVSEAAQAKPTINEAVAKVTLGKILPIMTPRPQKNAWPLVDRNSQAPRHDNKSSRTTLGRQLGRIT